jgi:hypothetical protein
MHAALTYCENFSSNPLHGWLFRNNFRAAIGKLEQVVPKAACDPEKCYEKAGHECTLINFLTWEVQKRPFLSASPIFFGIKELQ